MDVIGFTLNPEHIEALSPAAEQLIWETLFLHYPRLRLVVLSRQNIIKSAISGYLGNKLKKKCGINNLKHKTHFSSLMRVTSDSGSGSGSVSGDGSNAVNNKKRSQSIDCGSNTNPLTRVDWSVAQFRAHLNKWLRRTHQYHDTIRRIMRIRRNVTLHMRTAAAVADGRRLQSLGTHTARGGSSTRLSAGAGAPDGSVMNDNDTYGNEDSDDEDSAYVHEVRYEDLQLDKRSRIIDLLVFAFNPAATVTATATAATADTDAAVKDIILMNRSSVRGDDTDGREPAAAAGRAKRQQRGWIKRTSDDLSLVLVHYASVYQALNHSTCACLRIMLTATDASSSGSTLRTRTHTRTASTVTDSVVTAGTTGTTVTRNHVKHIFSKNFMSSWDACRVYITVDYHCEVLKL